jgi:hypothetical protein
MLRFLRRLFAGAEPAAETKVGDIKQIPQVTLDGLFDKELGNTIGKSGPRAVSVGPSGRSASLRPLIGDTRHLGGPGGTARPNHLNSIVPDVARA